MSSPFNYEVEPTTEGKFVVGLNSSGIRRVPQINDAGEVAVSLSMGAGVAASIPGGVDVNNFPTSYNVVVTNQPIVEVSNLPVIQEVVETGIPNSSTSLPTVNGTSSVVAAPDPNRKITLISNSGSDDVFFNFNAPADFSHHKVVSGGTLRLGAFTGSITAISPSTQTICVTEFGI